MGAFPVREEEAAIGKFLKRFCSLFIQQRITTSAAGLSYYITMTFFPLIICIYTLLGNNYELTLRVLEFLQPFLPEKGYDAVSWFMEYISENYSMAMMIFSLSVIVITASAGIRSLEAAIGQMQGRRRYEGVFSFFFSITLSLAFLFLIFFAIVAMFMGETILSHVTIVLPFLHADNMWLELRYPLLFVLAFILNYLMYLVCRTRNDHYSIAPGALISTLALVGVSALFSRFINESIKYPLIYSSMASLILIMFWLYCCCLAVYSGAVFNISMRDVRAEKRALAEAAEDKDSLPY